MGIYSSAIARGMFIDDIEGEKKTCMLCIWDFIATSLSVGWSEEGKEEKVDESDV